MLAFLTAALSWDPQIRGGLIVLTAILILAGSVYLLLATNTGSRVGLLLAVAGLTGWLTIMGVVWMVFGIGMKGREPHWKPKELIVGSLVHRSTLKDMETFPNGWHKLDKSDKILADAQAAADSHLAPSATGHETKEPTPEERARFASPYSKADDYIQVAGYDKGGDNYLFRIRGHKFYLRHSPHYAVIQVQAVLKDCTAGQVSTPDKPCLTPLPPGSAPRQPEPDPTKPVTTLIMVRDLGSIRFPPFLLTVFSLIVFLVTVSALHERDKEIMRARGQIPQPA